MPSQPVRTFDTGATRNTDMNKLDYEGFLHPMVLRAFAEYMHTHRVQVDGTMRSADNWQKGIPLEVYMSSLCRHFIDLWSLHRGVAAISPETGRPVDKIEALMACLFNIQGYAFELLKTEVQKKAAGAAAPTVAIQLPVTPSSRSPTVADSKETTPREPPVPDLPALLPARPGQPPLLPGVPGALP